MFGIGGELQQGVGTEPAAGPVRDVVGDDRQRAGRGDGAEVVDDPGLRRPGVVRHHDEQGGGVGHRRGPLDDLVDRRRGAVGPGADDERTAAITARTGHRVDDGAPLGAGERRRLARGAEHDEPGRPVVEQAAGQPAEGVDVDRVVGRERGDDGDPEAAQIDGHGAIMGGADRKHQFRSRPVAVTSASDARPRVPALVRPRLRAGHDRRRGGRPRLHGARRVAARRQVGARRRRRRVRSRRRSPPPERRRRRAAGDGGVDARPGGALPTTGGDDERAATRRDRRLRVGRLRLRRPGPPGARRPTRHGARRRGRRGPPPAPVGAGRRRPRPALRPRLIGRRPSAHVPRDRARSAAARAARRSPAEHSAGRPRRLAVVAQRRRDAVLVVGARAARRGRRRARRQGQPRRQPRPAGARRRRPRRVHRARAGPRRSRSPRRRSRSPRNASAAARAIVAVTRRSGDPAHAAVVAALSRPVHRPRARRASSLRHATRPAT